MRRIHWGVWTAGIAALALAASFSLGTILSMRGQIRELSEQLASVGPKTSPPGPPRATGGAAMIDVAKLRDEAEALNRRAERTRAEAEKIRAEAVEIRRLAEEMTFREAEKMHQLYPGLKKLGQTNRINAVSSFKVTGSPILSTGPNVIFEHANQSGSAVSPSFSVRFVDKNGFTLDSVRVDWVLGSDNHWTRKSG
jgi:hypothetical protein